MSPLAASASAEGPVGGKPGQALEDEARGAKPMPPRLGSYPTRTSLLSETACLLEFLAAGIFRGRLVLRLRACVCTCARVRAC